MMSSQGLKKNDTFRGKLANVIEELVLQHFDKPICDVVMVNVSELDDYFIVISSPNYYGNEDSKEITRYIENLIGIKPVVFFKQTENCELINR